MALMDMALTGTAPLTTDPMVPGVGTSSAALPRPPASADLDDENLVLDLTVVGLLDDRTGDALLAAVVDAAEAGWHRVEIDLRDVTAHTAQGTAAISRLCRTGSRLPRGIGFSVESGPSRDALLASLAKA